MRKKNVITSAVIKRVAMQSIIYLELIFVTIIVLYPLLWIVGTSFDSINNLGRTSIIPQSPTIANYMRLLTKTKYISWYANSAYIAVLTMVFSVLLNITTGFVFARFKFKGRQAGLLFATIIQIFPSFMGLTALYMIAMNFNLLNNLNMLVIVYVAGAIPTNIWLINGNLQNLPKSLDEAAYLDGATKLQVFIKILLPLSRPTISFIALTAFMAPWMDYMLPRFIIRSTEKQTLAIGLYNMADYAHNVSPDLTAFCAGAILIAVPITILYMIFQRFLITGITAGANKGE